ncbi:MAG TPA: aromatic-ring-hydroxylating dioxygenase subunit beta [Phenylobacterium sp.]|uniref:aromatic-ring-hydroxylating dioxygenase subunit beta n=1 Tax=Phenylobacterium sp. TaxID=1871053 RepID=UPI002B4A310C|nr:aromatic-ring-hydroxylating dioxygenase subunit beta [Phenylobacterium sp.]HKR87107.1 aromatic-ring-hydroxylating dioxygenase subunit beta [Phenylobacterium sp.]HKT54103.1 aromatic-ring-hydroxylating dioxygenase subunit beta [Caulobacteraceae bacterium]
MSLSTDAGLSAPTLNEAIEFIWTEADLLDAKDYREWLTLWRQDGIYVVPIDPATEDFEAQLNYAYDDAEMRLARVNRLMGGSSMSAVAAPRTVRTVSRFRRLGGEGARLQVRCAQLLVEHKRDVERCYAADVTYDLVREEQGLKLARKVVRLVNAAEALAGIAYLL